MIRRLASRVTPAILVAILGCSPPPPLPNAPPPEYEPGRPQPGTLPSAAGAEDEHDILPEGPPFGDATQLRKAVDTYMSGYGSKWGEAYAPSGILEVLFRGQIVYSRVFGKADRGTGAAPTPGTQFRIGSLTKQFTAAAILKLVEQGTIKLEDPAKTYVTELPDAFKDVTIQELLQQTSGIPAYTDDPTLRGRKKDEVPEADVLAWIAKQSPKSPPGKAWSYSNSNYYLLSIVAERAAKKPIGDVLKTLVLDPAGMKATTPVPWSGPVAVGYRRTASDALVPADVVSGSLPLGAGFLYSTVGDLALWDQALNGTSVLSEKSKSKMFSVGLSNYAMGWVVDVRQGTVVTWHNGGIDGYSAYFARAADRQIAVVFLSNVMEFDTTKPGKDVLDMALGGPPIAPVVERDTVKMDDALVKALEGQYQLTAESEGELQGKGASPDLIASVETFSFTSEDGGLIGKPGKQPKLVFKLAPDGVVFNASAGVEVIPNLEGEKTAKGFTVHQGDQTLLYVRVKPGAPPKPETAAPKKKP